MKSYPHFSQRKVIPLDGTWDFTFLGNVPVNHIDISSITFTDKMIVPAAYDALPAYAGKRGLAVYRKFIRISPGSLARIHFEAVSMWCQVYIDGINCGEHACGYSGFWVDLPSSGQDIRELVVLVDNRFDLERIPLHEPYFDFYHWGGIIRSAWLHEVPTSFIDTVHISVLDFENGKINVKIKFGGEHVDNVPLKFYIDDKPLTGGNYSIQDGIVKVDLDVPNPQPWSIQSPKLYQMKVIYLEDDMIVRFGLRKVETSGKQILLNGKPIKLLGYNRHESHPQFGPAVPDSLMLADLQMLRDLGANFIRGSHYQQDQRFLDLCDEMGFLVWEEALGWQQLPRHFNDTNYVKAHFAQIREMISTSYNHPCVIMLGFLNEAHTEADSAKPLFDETIALIKSLDPDRLVTYATCRLKQDICLEPVDVVSLNIYPGWYPGWGETWDENDPSRLIQPAMHDCLKFLEESGLGDRPVIFSEIGADAIYGWHDPMQGHWTEEYQAKYLDKVCEEVTGNENISGLSIWQFCDVRSAPNYYSLHRPRAFNNKGTVDEYRRPKQAYGVVKSYFSKMDVRK
ncbi:MAG TPA: glycoside hydrolase family 2 TIM barrel-domain containing protein [Anaerolineaceae bacterium]